MVNWGQTRHGDGDDTGGIPAIRQKITMICLRRIDMKPKEIAVGLQGSHRGVVAWGKLDAGDSGAHGGGAFQTVRTRELFQGDGVVLIPKLIAQAVPPSTDKGINI